LNIKPFTNKVMDWPRWYSSYKSAIHERDDLTAGEKFDYLESYLRDQAKLAISNMEPSEETYAEALAILEEMYGKKDVLIAEHIRQLENLKKSNATPTQPASVSYI